MKAIAVIPARLAATRFPNKPLAKIAGMPMIGHVYKRTAMSPDLEETYVATCDKEIYDYIRSIGGKAVMTRDGHTRCTDRTAEALLKIQQELGYRPDLVVMVQGDEPMVTPQMISASLTPFKMDPSVKVVNLMADLKEDDEFEDANEVKVVVDRFSRALYFSREPIPSRRKGGKNFPRYKQVCIIPFTSDYLLEYTAMEETMLEKVESVDMMRVLENGHHVHMVYFDCETYSVDTPEDLAFVEEKMKTDQLVKSYIR